MTSIILNLLQIALGLGISYQLTNKANKDDRLGIGWLCIIIFASYLVYLNNYTLFENYLLTTTTALAMSYAGSTIIKKNEWVYLASVICGVAAMILIVIQWF